MYRPIGQPFQQSPQPQNAQAGPSTPVYNSPGGQPAFAGYASSSYGEPQPPFQQMQHPAMGSPYVWNAPQGAFGQLPPQNQAPVRTPGPKHFSWGLPIADESPKPAADETHQGSPESPRLMQTSPNSTPNRAGNPFYHSFDADDEAPPRETTLGLEDDEMASSPPPVASKSAAAPAATSQAPVQPPVRRDQPPQLPAQSTHKVVVFGFSPASQAAVVEAFRAVGEVVDMQQQGPHAGANWLTLSYAKAGDATVALRKSGDIIGGTMIGVRAADDGPTSAFAEPGNALVATSNRRPPPLGERVNVLSAEEALKRPSTPGSPGSSMLLRLAKGSQAAPAAGAPAVSPHAHLFTQQGTPAKGGWTQVISQLVFGE